MKNPFKNEIEEPEITEEKPNWKVEIGKLQAEAFTLMGKITAESHIPTKRKLSEKRAEILKQIDGLTLKMNSEQENNALKLLDKLFNKHRKRLFLKVNDSNVKIPENFTINLKFRPCKHTYPFHIRELLTLQKAHINNKILLTKWQALLTSNMTVETRFSCEECKKEIAQKFQKTHIHSENDIVGQVKVSLTKI